MDIFVAVLQHPESQHVLIGGNATFSCRIRYAQSSIRWEELFSDGAIKTSLSQDEGNGVYVREDRTSNDEYNSTLTIVITCSNIQRWNGTSLQCSARTGSGRPPSNRATLAIHKSLSKTQCIISSTHTSMLIYTLVWYVSKICNRA